MRRTLPRPHAGHRLRQDVPAIPEGIWRRPPSLRPRPPRFGLPPPRPHPPCPDRRVHVPPQARRTRPETSPVVDRCPRTRSHEASGSSSRNTIAPLRRTASTAPDMVTVPPPSARTRAASVASRNTSARTSDSAARNAGSPPVRNRWWIVVPSLRSISSSRSRNRHPSRCATRRPTEVLPLPMKPERASTQATQPPHRPRDASRASYCWKAASVSREDVSPELLHVRRRQFQAYHGFPHHARGSHCLHIRALLVRGHRLERGQVHGRQRTHQGGYRLHGRAQDERHPVGHPALQTSGAVARTTKAPIAPLSVRPVRGRGRPSPPDGRRRNRRPPPPP